jgi:hypothetical protein
MFREFLVSFEMRRARCLDSKLLIPTDAHADNRIRGTEHDHNEVVPVANQPLHPESAIERAILNRFAHMLR